MTKRLPSGFHATLVRLSSWDWDILVRNSPVWPPGGHRQQREREGERERARGGEKNKQEGKEGRSGGWGGEIRGMKAGEDDGGGVNDSRAWGGERRK